MRTLIIDIETIGEDWAKMDETSQDVLTRWIKKESADEDEFTVRLDDLKNGLGFSPLTGEIVAIGMYDLEKNKGAVYFQAPAEVVKDFEEGIFKYKAMDEKKMLEEFWRCAIEYDTFVTFNGRCFDAPFMAIRSVVHNVRPTKDLLSNRYTSMQRGCRHVDLLDQLSFYGASRFKGANLHMYCRAFGIESPKASGVAGDDVAGLFKAKRFADIARYNAGDLIATARVYERWQHTLG